MTARLHLAAHGPRPGQQPTPRGRLVALLAVLALHGAGLAALLSVAPPPAPRAPVLLEARLIAEAPVVAVPPPPPPAAPQRPKPPPTLMASPRPTPSPVIVAPPPPDAATEPDAPAEPAPDAPPAPPVPAPAAEPAVVPPSFVAAYLNNPPPIYPQAAKLRRESGEVRLRVRVMTDGSAGDVQIERSSGSERLDLAAREVVFRRWRFVPARRGEVAVEAWVIVPIVFALK